MRRLVEPYSGESCLFYWILIIKLIYIGQHNYRRQSLPMSKWPLGVKFTKTRDKRAEEDKKGRKAAKAKAVGYRSHLIRNQGTASAGPVSKPAPIQLPETRPEMPNLGAAGHRATWIWGRCYCGLATRAASAPGAARRWWACHRPKRHFEFWLGLKM